MARYSRPEAGKVRYPLDVDDVVPMDYLEVECGGGGKCLFLSLAFVLGRVGIATTAAVLRASASATLVQWAQPNLNPPFHSVPENVNTFGQIPSLHGSQALAKEETWGDLLSIVAIVHQYMANNVDLEVHVLGPTGDDVHIVRSASAPNESVPKVVHIVFRSYVHFRALVPATADLSGIPVTKIVANFDTALASESQIKKVDASLNRKRGASDHGGRATSTVNITPGSSIEIHHIDVGQGDATLIYIKDVQGQIQRSILVDTAISADPVKHYLDAQINSGNFRPIDVLVLSHWDEDHIRGAPNLLRFNGDVGALKGIGYFNRPLQIFDVGDGSVSDSDYDNFIQAITELGLETARKVPLPGEILVTCLGVTITCLARLELGLYPFVNALDEEGATLYKYWNVNSDIIPVEDLNEDDVVNIATEPGAGTKNNASIALLLTFGEFTYFSAGDLEHHAEVVPVAYAREALGRHVCAWKMSHHGSHASATAPFFYYAAPRFGVASCGTGNIHGHPGRAIQARINDVNAVPGCACTYYVTQAVSDDATKFSLPDNATSFASQGNVVITVTDLQAADPTHPFDVQASGSQGKLQYKCGDRSDCHPSIKKYSDLVKQIDPGRKQASNERKKKRLALENQLARQWLYKTVATIIGRAEADSAGIDGWLTSKGLDKRFGQVVEQLRKSYRVSAEDMEFSESQVVESHEADFAKDLTATAFLDKVRSNCP